jgi:hypothetical protein
VELRDIADVVGEHSGRCRTVLEYGLTVQRVVDAAGPGFTADAWAPLAAFVDPERFERVGAFQEVQDWPTYVAFLTEWAPTAEWAGRFRRVTDHDGLVFLELEEWTRTGGHENVVNSVSVYAFDDYLQMDLSGLLGA